MTKVFQFPFKGCLLGSIPARRSKRSNNRDSSMNQPSFLNVAKFTAMLTAMKYSHLRFLRTREETASRVRATAFKFYSTNAWEEYTFEPISKPSAVGSSVFFSSLSQRIRASKNCKYTDGVQRISCKHRLSRYRWNGHHNVSVCSKHILTKHHQTMTWPKSRLVPRFARLALSPFDSKWCLPSRRLSPVDCPDSWKFYVKSRAADERITGWPRRHGTTKNILPDLISKGAT